LFDLYITHFISEIIKTTAMTHLKRFKGMLCVHSLLTVCCVNVQHQLSAVCTSSIKFQEP